ncbi:MAG TPA: methylmalonyl-CoA mutase subunit beta [Pseudonocardiaceae bacterium]|nr:methylmalonyl-CoA mutase subunit beta [Pseudonocardiaceae bacterium]
MTTPPDKLALASDFPAPTRQEWRALVKTVLEKAGRTEIPPEAEQALVTTTYDGIDIAPLYTAPAPDAGLPGLPPFVRNGRPEGATAAGWDVRARYDDPDPAEANADILTDLEHGVGSVWLVAGPGGVPVAGLGAALSGVLLDLAPVTLDAGADYAAAATALLAVYEERGVPAAQVGGNLGVDPIGVLARTGESQDLAAAASFVAAHAANYPGLRGIVVDALPYHEAGGSEAMEVGCAVAAGVAYLRALTDAGLDVDTAAGQLEFRFAASADQFLTIAKLRAARRLWARVTEVCGVRPEGRAQRQHAVTSPAMMTRRDPWVNMLRTTVACFAAGVGGADAVTVIPFDAAIGRSNDFARRIARNTQSILLEESRLAAVIDPAGGSWYVETLTAELADVAWRAFTDLERDGGIVPRLESGRLAASLDRMWQERRRRISTRQDAITGVSEYPNLTERPVDRPPLPERPGGGLPRVRYAEDFEALRDRADAADPEPVVYLATLGPVAAHSARVGFATNLLQAGGIRTPTGPVDGFAASGARVACLCGSDRSYDEEAETAIAALRAAGAVRVMIAGSKAHTADDTLYRGCDALNVLHTTWETLEATA